MMNKGRINAVKIGMFHFRFGNMTVFQSALMKTKIDVMREQVVDDMWPIGDFIYFIHKLCIPFQLTYIRPEGVNDKQSEHLYMDEFLPLYVKCIQAGIIARPDYTTT